MGKLKRRIGPSDVVINIGRDAPIPECPIPGERYLLFLNFGEQVLKANEYYGLEVIAIF